MSRIHLLYLLLMLVFSCKSKQEVDFIVQDAIIYTVDSSFSKASSFAVKDGKFVAIGTDEEIMSNYTSKNIMDAQQKTILPGFYDAHCHYYTLGKLLNELDLTTFESFEQLLSNLKIYAQKKRSGGWIIGRGWTENKWKEKIYPTKEKIDKMFPKTPVFLTRIDGHAALVNQVALDLAKITTNTKIEGGQIEIKNGKLTGILTNNAMNLVRNLIPEPSLEEKKEMLLHAQEVCFSKGLTTISDAGMDKSTVELIDQMQKDKTLKIRIYAMLNPTEENKAYFLKKGIYKTDRLNVRAFKFYIDGSLGSRGALLLKPYNDDPKRIGSLVTPREKLKADFEEMFAKGFQASADCVGDSANRMVLNLYGEVLKTQNDRRWRIEHVQTIDSSDVVKFKNFSVIPSVQPIHCISDMVWAGERLGNDRLKKSYAYKFLSEQSKYIAFGSDFPVVDADPIYTFHAAIARQDSEHSPEDGFQAENGLDKNTAIKAMTIWAAYTNFEDLERGSIEKGKMADFIILDTDLLDTDPRLLRLSKVLNTFVGGEKVFSNYESGY